MPLTENTARVMAKNWRADPEARATIERCITARNAWGMFRKDRDGKLVARISLATRLARIGADCHFYTRAPAGV